MSAISGFAVIGLQWYAAPFLPVMILRIGGVDFPAATFSRRVDRNRDRLARHERCRPQGCSAHHHRPYGSRPHSGFCAMEQPRDWGAPRRRASLAFHSNAGVRLVDHQRASSEFLGFVAPKKTREGLHRPIGVGSCCRCRDHQLRFFKRTGKTASFYLINSRNPGAGYGLRLRRN
jgi:hypothetical protein